MTYGKLETSCLIAGLTFLSVSFLVGLPLWMVFTGTLCLYLSLGFLTVRGSYQLGYVYGAILTILGILQLIYDLPQVFGTTLIVLGFIFSILQYIEKKFKSIKLIDYLMQKLYELSNKN